MRTLLTKLDSLSKHLRFLDSTFRSKRNFSDANDFDLYNENEKALTNLIGNEKLKHAKIKSLKYPNGNMVESSFSDEIYSEYDRQMKLADIIEYFLYSRGVYYLFQGTKFKNDRVPKFIEINLRIVNLLMIYETITVDKKLRNAFLTSLKGLIGKEDGFSELENWKSEVGLNEKNKKYNKAAPNDYFDSLLPKTAGGLWNEILVYCFLLRYNVGFIFPLLLTQKPISLKNKLSPPDLVILHTNTYRFYGIEIGSLKERQSGGFMAPSGLPIIPIDTSNARMSDRCPSCNKWIGICPKVINDFSNPSIEKDQKIVNEIRCLTECDIYTLDQQLNGDCKYMKFRYENKNWNFPFADDNHHHYHCGLKADESLRKKIVSTTRYNDLKRLSVLRTKRGLSDLEKAEKIKLQSELISKYSYIKTHSIYYSELIMLCKMNSDQSTTSIVEDIEANNEEE